MIGKYITSIIADPKMLLIETTVGAALLHYLKEIETETLFYAVPTIFVIFADLYWGICAAIKRKERVTVTSAFRRTFNKIIGYSCWIVFSVSIGITYDISALPKLMMLLVFILEGSSCANNILDKYNKRISVKGILSVIGKKRGYDGFENIIEDKTQKEK